MARESFLHRMERTRRERRAQAEEAAAYAETEAAMPRIDRSEWIASWRNNPGVEFGETIQRSAA